MKKNTTLVCPNCKCSAKNTEGEFYHCTSCGSTFFYQSLSSLGTKDSKSDNLSEDSDSQCIVSSDKTGYKSSQSPLVCALIQQKSEGTYEKIAKTGILFSMSALVSLALFALLLVGYFNKFIMLNEYAFIYLPLPMLAAIVLSGFFEKHDGGYGRKYLMAKIILTSLVAMALAILIVNAWEFCYIELNASFFYAFFILIALAVTVVLLGVYVALYMFATSTNGQLKFKIGIATKVVAVGMIAVVGIVTFIGHVSLSNDPLKYEVLDDGTYAVVGLAVDNYLAGQIKEINIPSIYNGMPVTEIDELSRAYVGYNDLSAVTSITIPSSVTTIGSSVFKGCSSLTSITIPSSVTTMGGSAFSGCTNLIVYAEAESKPIGWSDNWSGYEGIKEVVWGYDIDEDSNDS